MSQEPPEEEENEAIIGRRRKEIEKFEFLCCRKLKRDVILIN